MPPSPKSAARDAIRAALQHTIGEKYEILQWIGGGGMAEVFLARHRIHGALFAVKVLSDQLAGEPAIVARFVEEARTATTLRGHPNIAEIFDIGDSSGLHYLIMPYVEGEDLKNYLERHGRLKGPEALQVIVQVTEALVWAGERNVVHRDLKPSNIRIDRSGRAIVLDFGIAKANDVPTTLTRPGERLGTPFYMSPEQIKGEKCDARSDLYALGITFFELLAGRKPFTGDNLQQIDMAHVHQAPPTLCSLIPDVDPRFELVIDRLLRKKPAERYQSARFLLDDLRTLSQGMPPVHLEPQIQKLDLPSQNPGAPTQTIALPQIAKKGLPAWAIPAFAGVLLLIATGIYFATRGPAKVEKAAAQNLPATFSDVNGPMLLVPAGKFVFGSNEADSPRKRQDVDLPAFYVDTAEVSNAQFQNFVQSTGHKPPDSEDYKTKPSFPVSGVNLDDASGYCVWAGRRLPNEQEWEKAARGVAGNVYPWGNQPLPNPGKIVPVESYPERKSPYGALNMAGNVFEWTVSPFPVTDREIEDMKKQSGGREVSSNWCSIKGGSFLLKDDRFFKAYIRRGWPTNQTSPSLGFRCVKDAK